MATVTETATYTVPRGPVAAKLMYYKGPEDGSGPYFYMDQPPPGVAVRNFSKEEHIMTISDLRGKESEFNLDSNALLLLQGIKSAEKEFMDDEQIKRIYYPEVEKILLDNVPGAHKVFFFDHTVRRSIPNAPRRPVYDVHIDQTAKAAAGRVRQHLPEEAEKLLQGRYQIINVWRPINGTVYADPLAFADANSVVDSDVVAVKRLTADRIGETANVKYNSNHKWLYWSGMTNDEMVLIKCFDSDPKVGKWGRVPHTAFQDSRTPPEAPGRESIEVRALVFG